MGGADAVISARARISRRGSTVGLRGCTSQLVFADPANTEARELGADALEQLGYQSEAATWRNAYLLGAHELRNGVAPQPPAASTGQIFSRASPSISPSTSSAYGSTRRRPKASTSSSTGPSPISTRAYVMNLENSALTHTAGKLADNRRCQPDADPRRTRCHHAEAAHLCGQHQSGRHQAQWRSDQVARAVRSVRRVHYGLRDRRAAEGEGGIAGRSTTDNERTAGIFAPRSTGLKINWFENVRSAAPVLRRLSQAFLKVEFERRVPVMEHSVC